MEWAREEFARERGLERDAARGPTRAPRRVVRPAPPPPPVEPVRDDLEALDRRFREALPGSLGEKYLEYRGVSLDAAREYGVGYAERGEWPHRGRDWRWGRIVAPHTRPDGTMVSLYGRAVGSDGKVPKQMRHDHLPGSKGYFNARALSEGTGPLHVCEGVMDALALIASGCERTVAIFSARDWRWHWLPDGVRRLMLAFDCDGPGGTGEDAREKLAGEARLRGIEVAYLDGDSYGGEDDPAAAFAAGTLDVGEWPDDEGRLPKDPPPAEAWEPGWAAGLFPEVLASLSNLTQEAGIGVEAVDTEGFGRRSGGGSRRPVARGAPGRPRGRRCGRTAGREEGAPRGLGGPGVAGARGLLLRLRRAADGGGRGLLGGWDVAWWIGPFLAVIAASLCCEASEEVRRRRNPSAEPETPWWWGSGARS